MNQLKKLYSSDFHAIESEPKSLKWQQVDQQSICKEVSLATIIYYYSKNNEQRHRTQESHGCY